MGRGFQSSFLSGIAHLDLDIRNSAAYIKGWASALRDNQKWIMWAAARAEKAADYILGTPLSSEIVEEKTSAEMVTEVSAAEPAYQDLPF